MRIRVQAQDEQEYRELKYRLFDVWDDEAYVIADDELLRVIVVDPPTALMRELADDCGYDVTEIKPAAV